MVLRGHVPSLTSGQSFLAACLLASATVLVAAADSRLAVESHRAWAAAWAGGGSLFFLFCLRARAGGVPGLVAFSAPLWLLAGIAGAAVLGGHALDVLAASSIPIDLDSSTLPGLGLGDAILLGILGVPVLLVWFLEFDRGGSPSVRLLGMLGFGLLATVLLSVLLDGGVAGLKVVPSEPTAALMKVLCPLGWMLAAFAYDGARCRALRGEGLAGLFVGGAVGFVLIPAITVIRRPLGLRSLDEHGLFELLVGESMGKYGGELASGMEAGLCAIAASALLILCMRNAVYGWRALPGFVGVLLPVVAVYAQAGMSSDSLLTAAMWFGWAAVLIGVPFTGWVSVEDT